VWQGSGREASIRSDSGLAEPPSHLVEALWGDDQKRVVASQNWLGGLQIFRAARGHVWHLGLYSR
jgi:hypothetical protein